MQDGQTAECILEGEIEGGSIRQGDSVEVRGRPDRSSRTLAVNRIVNMHTGAVTTGRRPLTARLAPVVTLVFILLLIAALVSEVL
jgi:hypothetical protein